MNKTELYYKLNYVDHSRSKRSEMATLVLLNPDLVLPLMNIALQIQDPISARACWVLEFTAAEDLRYLDPHLDLFTELTSGVRLESAVRPIAKICEYLILEYYKAAPENNPSKLSADHLEHIATSCFDWLIGPFKVAPKAYSMTCLYHLGRSFDWIHPELTMVLEKDIHIGSAAYKARARHILSRL